MRGHAAFESLAGAIALGEATSLERERFAAHAHGCDRCRADLDHDPLAIPSALRAVAAQESWRPDARDRVNAAIAVRRRGRVRTIGTWIATAAAFSVALDVGFSSGSFGRVLAQLSTGPAASAPLAFVPKAPLPKPVVPVPPVVVPAVVATHVRPHHATVAVVVPAPVKPAPKTAVIKPASDEPALPFVDDVFKGLASDTESEKQAPHLAKVDPATSEPPAGSGSADAPESTVSKP